MKFTADEFLVKLPLAANEKWISHHPDGEDAATPPQAGGEQLVWDVEPFKKGNVSLVFFAPRVVDNQTAHDEDEFYFIVRGTGDPVIGVDRHPFASGDAFFVEAGVPHHFENFTDDFARGAVFF